MPRRPTSDAKTAAGDVCAIKINLPPLVSSICSKPGSLSADIRILFQTCQFYDVNLVVGTQRFCAHQAVLASTGEPFRQRLRDALRASEKQVNSLASTLPELHLPEISSHEAVAALLDFVYNLRADYSVSADADNKDVLRSAQVFGIHALEEQAMIRLTRDLSTANVVERLAICDDLDLKSLHNLILAELAMNQSALQQVSRNPEMSQHPKIMQEVLLLALGEKPELPISQETVPRQQTSSGKRRRSAAASLLQHPGMSMNTKHRKKLAKQQGLRDM